MCSDLLLIAAPKYFGTLQESIITGNANLRCYSCLLVDPQPFFKYH